MEEIHGGGFSFLNQKRSQESGFILVYNLIEFQTPNKVINKIN